MAESQYHHRHNEQATASTLDLPETFLDDPAVFLTAVASEPPSRQGLAWLAGSVAQWFVAAAPSGVCPDFSLGPGPNVGGNPATQVAALYLQAAAVQLRDSVARAAAVGDVEQEMTRSKHLQETLSAVGAAATLCPNRMAIASSGILPTLAQLMTTSPSLPASFATSSGPVAAVAAAAVSPIPPFGAALQALSPGFAPTSTTGGGGGGVGGTTSQSYPPLHQASVEFLQCAVLAEQYRYAARMVEGTWPCPTNAVTVTTVLRYFYVRGLVHLGCQDYRQAHRCWWTCLSVPAESCSPFMVHAWKKLVLVQPLVDRHWGTVHPHSTAGGAGTASQRKLSDSAGTTVGGNTATRLPKSIPKCMIRMLASAKENRDQTILLYTQLGPAVQAGDPDVVQTLIHTHEALLKADGNYDLAQECYRRVQDIQVWKDSQLFSVVPVGLLAQRWKVPVEQVPQRLTDSKVPCRIEEDGMVVFGRVDENNDASTTSTSTSWIDLSEWMQLLERIQQLDVNISISSSFHAMIRNEEKITSTLVGVGSAADPTGPVGPRGVEEF